jgi:hypothetical protein
MSSISTPDGPSFLRKNGTRLAYQLACLTAGWAAALASIPRCPGQVTGFSGFSPVNTSGTGTASGISVDGSTFQLTNNISQAASAFFLTPQTIGPIWEADFTYSMQNVGTGQADGFAFVLQNDPRGAAALGEGGGAVGYGGTGALTNSVAYSVNVFGTDSHAVRTNGGAATGTVSTGSTTFLGTTPPQLPYSFKLTYAGGQLMATLRNPNNAATASPASNIGTFTLNVPGTIGSSAYIGFSGATGGQGATQTIGNFKFRTTTGSAYAPIRVTGFNADPVADPGLSVPLSTNTTIDGGLNKTGDTFYAVGTSSAIPGRGLAMGNIVTSATDTAHTYALQAANVNNALLLSRSQSLRLTFDVPQSYEALSFLTTSGNGSAVFSASVNFSDGSTEVLTGLLAPDWFNAGGAALSGLGRVNQSGGFSEATSTNPRLYQQDVILTNQSLPITSIDFLQTAGNSSGANAFIFAVSGVVPVPEPTTSLTLAAAACGFLTRRRRPSADLPAGS